MYAKGRSAVTPFLVVYCRPNRLGHNRLGVTVSTKLGGAVVRNRARRRLRELYRLAQPNMRQGYDLVLVARSRAVDGPWRRMDAAFRKALGQLGLLGGGGGRREAEKAPSLCHPLLSAPHLPGAPAPVPLHPHLLPVCPGGHREVRPLEGRLAGSAAVFAMPPLL